MKYLTLLVAFLAVVSTNAEDSFQCATTLDCPLIECRINVVETAPPQPAETAPPTDPEPVFSVCRGSRGMCRRKLEQEARKRRELLRVQHVLEIEIEDGDPCPSHVCVENRCVQEDTPTIEQPRLVNPRVGGDPHFRTWSGAKFDYHGECDLVLLDHPKFANGVGLRVHIRTTRIKYFSFIETVVIQIGDDVLEFANDVDNFWINGKLVGKRHKHQETMLGGFVVRRDIKALSIRLDQDHYHQHKAAHIDLYYQKSGFPSVKVDAKDSNVFEGSKGLLGDYATGRMMARDGTTEITDATEYALEWQVREEEPMLFSTARFPQAPAKCVPPSHQLGKRLGDSHMKKMAEEACSAWGEDKDECIFDVMATRDVEVADVTIVS